MIFNDKKLLPILLFIVLFLIDGFLSDFDIEVLLVRRMCAFNGFLLQMKEIKVRSQLSSEDGFY